MGQNFSIILTEKEKYNKQNEWKQMKANQRSYNNYWCRYLDDDSSIYYLFLEPNQNYKSKFIPFN